MAVRYIRVVTFSLLDRPIQFLKGVGPARAEAFARMGVRTARDLLYWVPRRYDDASRVDRINAVEVGADATIVGRVISKGIVPTRRGLRIFQAVLQDDSGMITAAWPGQPWLDRKINKGDLILASGPVRFFHGRQIQPKEMTHLARGGDDGEGAEPSREVGKIFVSYPATEELPQWVLRSVIEKNLDALLDRVEEEEEVWSPSAREQMSLTDIRTALEAMHRPRSLEEVELGRRRLAFDELFFLQLVQARARHLATRDAPGIRFERTNELIRPLHAALPFSLTDAQSAALRDIMTDLTSGQRMNRLVQGDVGSGKTLVALFAMLLALEGGYQAALMAPTEILAEQHRSRMSGLLEPLGVRVVLLTGRLAAAERREVLGALASGEAQLVVGTHALIQQGVEFKRLGLVVVDEQHRFGVRQRMALGDRDEAPHTLVMSATPIPRSLAMALYGDLDLSIIDELPPGRTPIRTLLRFSGKRDEVYRLVRQELEQGHQAYVVFPLVEESEKVDLRSATVEFERLGTEVFPDRTLGLLHGKMSADEKYQTMHAFANGEIDVLVSTSLIEVGIDVANATIMVIEHAERFGLSQLHQMRGRVGRGGGASTCVMVAEAGEAALERLKVIRDNVDGFAIARADLRLRGQGDFFGDRQHGEPPLRFADLLQDEGLLVEAQQLARELISKDPDLTAPAQRKIRGLLETRHDERFKLFRVG